MLKRWKWLAVILLLAIAGGLGTFGAKVYYFKSEPEKPIRVRIVEVERSLLALPHYIAMSQGFYREQNLSLESVVNIDTPIEEWATKGKGDILLCNLSQSIFTRPLGTGADLVAFASLAGKDGTFLLGRDDVPDFSWDMLKRRSILGDSPDDQSNIILEEALKQSKLTLQQQVIIIQNIPLSLKEGAFQAGVGHYVQMNEPMATLTEGRGGGRRVVALGTTVGPIPAITMSASGDYIKRNSNTIQKVVNGLCKGMLWLDYHSTTEAAKVVEPYFSDLDQDTLVKIIERFKNMQVWSKSPAINKEDYLRLQKYVQGAGELTNPLDFKEGINNKFAARAARNVVYIPPDQQKEKTLWEKVKTLDFKSH